MTRNQHTRIIDRPNLNKRKKNKTTLFMLPALNLTTEKANFSLLEYLGFVNCYIEHKQGMITVPDCVYMVFNPSNEAIRNFSKFFEIYKTYPNFVDDYVVDRNLIVVVFKVKDKWRASYREFKKSNYSRMSKEYAELFKRPDLATGRVHTTTEYFIILKHKEYKAFLENYLDASIEDSAELMDRLVPEKEIFDYEYNIREDRREAKILAREEQFQITEIGGSGLHLLPA